jgi:hypothetical protein
MDFQGRILNDKVSSKYKFDKYFSKINNSLNTDIYKTKYVLNIFSSNDIVKINELINLLQNNLSKDEFNDVIFNYPNVNLNLIDNKYFKIDNFETIIKNAKKFNSSKLLGILNNFIIFHEKELKFFFKIKKNNSYHKNFIISEPIIYDYLSQSNIVDKSDNYKGVDYIPPNLLSYLNTNIWNDDISFINDTIKKIKEKNFINSHNIVKRLNKIMNTSTNQLIIKEQQLCLIINNLKKEYVNHDNFIDKLSYHGFVFAMNLIKQKFNIDCFSKYFLGFNKKIIQEDNGKLFEYLIVNNKIDTKKLDKKFIYDLLDKNKENIINIIGKHKCNFDEQITKILTKKKVSFYYRRGNYCNIFGIKNKKKCINMIKLCEKMGYIITKNVFTNIIGFYSDNEILENISKWKIEIDEIIHLLVKEKRWNLITTIFEDKKFNYFESTYIKNIHDILKTIKKTENIHDYLSICNYHLNKYNIVPPTNLKNDALYGLNFNLVKKLVENYKVKYSSKIIKNFLMTKTKLRKYGWSYYNRSYKIHTIVVIINYLSTKFEDIKKFYKDSEFIKSITKISNRIYEKTYLLLFENKELNLSDKNEIINIMESLSSNSLLTLLEKNNCELKNLVKEHQFLNENIYRAYLEKYKVKTLPFETILLSLFYSDIKKDFVNNLVLNDKLLINTNHVTFLTLAMTDSSYLLTNILLNVLMKYPSINHKTFKYIQDKVVHYDENGFTKNKYRRNNEKKIYECFKLIVDMKDNLTIISKDNPPYKIFNYTIDEQNLDVASYDIINCIDKLSELIYCGHIKIDSDLNLEFISDNNIEKKIHFDSDSEMDYIFQPNTKSKKKQFVDNDSLLSDSENDIITNSNNIIEENSDYSDVDEDLNFEFEQQIHVKQIKKKSIKIVD